MLSTLLLSTLYVGSGHGVAYATAAKVVEALGGALAQVAPDVGLLAAGLAFLVPAGLIMVAAGASSESEAPNVAAVGIASVALAVLAYTMVGFGLQFGGVGLISDLGGAESLRAEWSPLDVVAGPGWGIVGLDGFLLREGLFDQEVLALAFYHAALAAAALCIPALALSRRFGYPVLLSLGLFFALLVYPIYGNWVWGGGFLWRLGATLGIGHGVVDYAGSGAVHALGAFFALAVVLAVGARNQEASVDLGLPPARSPLLAVLGAFLLTVGWFGVLLGNPLAHGQVPYTGVLFNALVAACSGALVSSLYVWLVARSADLLMIARGTIAALVAVSACCPFVSPWAALAVGAVTGLLVPLSLYLFEVRLGLRDSAVALAVHGVPGLWGLLAVGIFADGSVGQGWHGVGVGPYLGVPGQGVSGLLVRSGFQPDWPGQMAAQMVGIVALMVLTLFLSWALLRGVGTLWERGKAGSADLRTDIQPHGADRAAKPGDGPQAPSC
ncbi:MAG TPA: hypothetical protein ENO24_05620 [Chloroflexi bacterium]|nr:hypothetical protein [Chloroflexota bacterium]